MPFRLFHDELPAIAERETRTLTLLQLSESGLPAGTYSFLEMFCDEPGCDCRRVFFMVMTSFRKGTQAVVAWGWEDVEFYSKWLKYGDRRDAEELQGPVLNSGSPETDLSEAILDLTREVLLEDPGYIERIQRHYRMFRKKVEARAKRRGGHRD
jgi:hypothetical protein